MERERERHLRARPRHRVHRHEDVGRGQDGHQTRPAVGRCSSRCDQRVQPDHSCSFWTSRPCIVSAQITAIATAMIAIPQIG